MDERWDQLYPGGYRFCFSDGAFKPSTDTFLLGGFAETRREQRVCDLGAGVGLLGLLLLSRQPSLHVTNIDVDERACALSRRSVEANGLTHRVTTVCADLRCRTDLPPANSFDVCVSNPPYFPVHAGKAAAGARGAARSELTCTFDELCAAASYLLCSGGRFYLIHRAERTVQLLETLRQHRLEPKELQFVQKDARTPPRLVLLGCRRDGGTGLTVRTPLLLYDESGGESAALRRIYFKDRGQ